MRIVLIRHAESEGNVDQRKYVEKGDQNVGLTEKGWQQSIACGEFLKGFYRQTPTWPVVFISPYQRPKQTFSGILHGMGGVISGQPKIYEDLRLSEKHYGAENVLEYQAGDQDLVTPELSGQLKKVYDAVSDKDPYTTRRLMGESSQDVMMRVKSLIDGTLQQDIREGKTDFLFMVHGAIIRDFLMSWFHLPMASRDDVPSPGNCDVIVIEDTSPKRWKATKVYDGELMKPVEIDFLAGLKPFCVADLPAIPKEFLELYENRPD